MRQHQSPLPAGPSPVACCLWKLSRHFWPSAVARRIQSHQGVGAPGVSSQPRETGLSHRPGKDSAMLGSCLVSVRRVSCSLAGCCPPLPCSTCSIWNSRWAPVRVYALGLAGIVPEEDRHGLVLVLRFRGLWSRSNGPEPGGHVESEQE